MSSTRAVAAEEPEFSPTHVVAKPFTGPNNRQYKSGEQVNASAWRNTERLVAARYLKPIPVEQEPVTDDALRLQALEERVSKLEAFIDSLSQFPAGASKKPRGKEAPDGNQSGQ